MIVRVLISALWLAACGGLAPVLPPTWAAQGWTPSPLDRALPRAGCPFGGEPCASGCRVELHRTDGEQQTVITHYLAAGLRAQITRRADGSAGARVFVTRDAESLDVLLELERSPEPIADDALLALLADPASAPAELRLRLSRASARTEGDEVITLDEYGGREPTQRFERHEIACGRTMWSRQWPSASAQAVQRGRTRQSVDGETRRIETLDHAGYLIEERVQGPHHSEVTTLRYDADGLLARIEDGGRPILQLAYSSDRTLITSRWYVPNVRARWGDGTEESSGGWIVRFDAGGHALGGWNRLDGSLLEVERDSSGRLVRYRVHRAARDEDHPPASFVIEIERDAQGRWTRERLASDSFRRGWSREVVRELDERGRVVRSSLIETTRHGDAAPTPGRSSVATYSYGEGCGVVEPPQPEGHDALLESPVEPRPE